MPCQSSYSAKPKKDCKQSGVNRARTASDSDLTEAQQLQLRHKLLQTKCKKMGNQSHSRLSEPIEMKFNDLLKITRAENSCHKTLPAQRIKVYPTLLPKRELVRLQEASKFFTLEERVEELARMEEESRRIEEESNKRKNKLKEIDDARLRAKLERDRASGIIQKDDSYNEEKVKVLEKAFVAKHEQEEEVKRANRIILNAKCHVIRDAQIQEKHELAREMRDDEIRLDRKMIDDARKSLQVDDVKADDERDNKLKYSIELKKQLEERENIRYLEAERIEEEAKMQAQANAAIRRDENRKKEMERKKREQLRKDLNQVSEMSALFKKLKFEQDKAAEMQVQAYMKAKAERERKIAIERQFHKEAFERKQQLLFSSQQKILSMTSAQGEENIRREQEDKEREYRRKEKEAAIRRKEVANAIALSREMQLNELKQRQALQMARNADDYKRTVQKLKEEEAKVKNTEQNRAKMRDKYREEIIKQMNQKELERREMDVRAKNDYMAWKEKEELREKNIRSVIRSKLKEMRDANLPEKYIKDVEKQLKVSLG